MKPVVLPTWTHIRTWCSPAPNRFRLRLFDTNTADRLGKSILAYQFFHKDRLVFQGSDFHCSPLHAIDSDETIGTLLNFLSLRPGDTDPEYFEGYTPEQLEWCQMYGETLAMCAEDLANG